MNLSGGNKYPFSTKIKMNKSDEERLPESRSKESIELFCLVRRRLMEVRSLKKMIEMKVMEGFILFLRRNCFMIYEYGM